jgi:hypothetical protein
MLKGAALQNLEYDAIALVALMVLAMTIAVTRFRRTLDRGRGSLAEGDCFACARNDDLTPASPSDSRS